MNPTTEAAPVLDASAVPPGDRRAWLVDLLDGMEPGASVTVAFDDHPLPLLDWLGGARFGEFSASFRHGPPGAWVAKLIRR